MPGDSLFFFDPDHLLPLARERHAAHVGAQPFPHSVIDGLLPEPVAQQLSDAFPAPDFPGFQRRDNAYQFNKQGRVQESYFQGVSPLIRHLLNEFNGQTFLDFLGELTGIRGLIADPHFFGGALHQILPGGKLGIHADFNRDERRKLDRRLNVLLYLNPDWQDDWGGHLELWPQDMSHCAARIAPVLNRCVVFNTTDTSYHGHPDPLNCPPGRSRNSIALYYYTNGRDDGSGGEGMFKTLWQKRPGE